MCALQLAMGRKKEGEPATPAVIASAGVVGFGVGAAMSGPALAVPMGVAAAGLCLRDDEVR